MFSGLEVGKCEEGLLSVVLREKPLVVSKKNEVNCRGNISVEGERLSRKHYMMMCLKYEQATCSKETEWLEALDPTISEDRIISSIHILRLFPKKTTSPMIYRHIFRPALLILAEDVYSLLLFSLLLLPLDSSQSS